MTESTDNKNELIPPHGGYRNLITYQRAQIIYDGTVYFCQRYFQKFDRTVDQMVQAARSGKQNIIEGSMVSATSKEMEIKLTSVARASLAELAEDYNDFLRTRKLKRWEMDHPLMNRFRELNKIRNASYETFLKGIEHPDPAISANVMVCLVEVTIYLLRNQMRSLEKAFIKEGGFREKMTRARLERRNRK
jgi:four helix bundle suffix protein